MAVDRRDEELVIDAETDAVDRFRTSLVRRLGLQFDETRRGFLDEVLGRRAGACKQGVAEYLLRLESGTATKGELRKLAEELTIGETYFFRNIEQFRAFEEVVLPARMAARDGSRTLRILSAGCASGEEPYSLAMSVRQSLPPTAGWNVEVRAIDINSAFLERARRGRYTAWSMRQTPADAQARWFRTAGREHVLVDEITAMVRFSEGNLVEHDRALWSDEIYDVVFCRNVLMYFSPEQARAVVERLAAALVPGGFLFLGHAESLRGLSAQFHLHHTHETFYYERKHPDDARAEGTATVSDRHGGAAPLVELVDSADSWVDAIRDAAQRIRTLVDDRTAPAIPDAPAVGRAERIAAALDMLGRERYGDALAVMDALPTSASVDPEVLLLRAVLLTHSGRLSEAEAVGRALLAVDELNAGAHYLLALCSEGGGDPGRAQEHDQVATYLDGGFAMPRLHLGLLARRRGDREAARRELGRALVLLQREDPARL
ncbi:MAG TPA: CheR family methyltransferase, partial [Nannocystaceae bacterium]|nr:CheR family methyltransferase [Nannocystaceae bacterium]